MTKDASVSQGNLKIVKYKDFDGNWRERVQMSRGTFTEEKKGEFLKHFAETGRMEHSAQLAGTTSVTVREHMKRDIPFAEAVEMCRSMYNDKRREVVDDLFFNPPTKTIYDRNGNVISEENLYMQNFIIKYMAAHCDEWKEKQDVTIHATPGVMVIPAGLASADEWEKKFGKNADRLTSGSTDILDVTYSDVPEKTPSPDGKSDS